MELPRVRLPRVGLPRVGFPRVGQIKIGSESWGSHTKRDRLGNQQRPSQEAFRVVEGKLIANAVKDRIKGMIRPGNF